MKRSRAFLLTSDELQFIAAASGMTRVLMFQPAALSDRTQKIQAVFKLIRDGFFIQKGNSIRIGANLTPFIEVFRQATNVIVARPADTESLAFCIYGDETAHEFVCISPHENREDTYKLSIADTESLMDDLETMRLLPVIRDDFLINEIPNRERQHLFNESESGGDDGILAAIGEDLVAHFERYYLQNETCTESITVFRAAPSWAIIMRRAEEITFSYYRRNDFVRWLEGWQNGEC